MVQRVGRPATGSGTVRHGRVTVPLVIRDLTRDDLPACTWSGGSLHLTAVAGELLRAEAGEVDYLAVCPPSGAPVAVGGVDFVPFSDAGYLWQLAVHPLLRRCGLGTLLVGALEDRVRRRGRSRAELRYEVHESGNRAFYEGLGYTAYGTVPDGWDQRLASGEIERYETTCVQMRRDLRPHGP
ncbi:GNAT family N-acetyltransferase [Nocardiopsis aegyptia]|uniref:GNAT family N-acetyltransferase n=1 Tax=Nocardiopsis aegyptia TaxID=220378 RepID=UPI00366F6B57